MSYPLKSIMANYMENLVNNIVYVLNTAKKHYEALDTIKDIRARIPITSLSIYENIYDIKSYILFYIPKIVKLKREYKLSEMPSYQTILTPTVCIPFTENYFKENYPEEFLMYRKIFINKIGNRQYNEIKKFCNKLSTLDDYSSIFYSFEEFLEYYREISTYLKYNIISSQYDSESNLLLYGTEEIPFSFQITPIYIFERTHTPRYKITAENPVKYNYSMLPLHTFYFFIKILEVESDFIEQYYDLINYYYRRREIII